MIDPRMDITSISQIIINSESKVLITLDIAFPKIKQIMGIINQDLIITQSAAASLPYIKKVVMTLKTKTDIPYSNKITKWSEFIKRGENVVAV